MWKETVRESPNEKWRESEAIKREEGQHQAFLNWQAAARKLIALFPSK